MRCQGCISFLTGRGPKEMELDANEQAEDDRQA